ncbi:MAG: hypothetical protein J0M04_12010 [Verrucomicrobia bacterium]|nr:hypothetical protein [Verrucomicrobiota bacterium]
MKALLVSALVGLLAATGYSQNTPTPDPSGNTANNQKTTDREADGHRRFWQGNLPGGSYVVALDKITSISRHSYAVVEAGMLVDEVVIDTIGQTVARFYFVRPITDGVNNNAVTNLNNRAKELLDYGGQRVGTDVHKGVTKKYPEGLYAKTIEYRVGSAEELGALFGSVRNAWDTGRGRIFTIK